MSEAEAKSFGISPESRFDYVRLDRAKTNLIRRSNKPTWFRLVDVALKNGTERYPNGDNIQTIEQWQPPDLWANLSTTALNAALTEIDAGLPDGQRYSDSSTAWKVVMKHCCGITKEQAQKIVQAWVKSSIGTRPKANGAKG
jgi:hypothetical protein